MNLYCYFDNIINALLFKSYFSSDRGRDDYKDYRSRDDREKPRRSRSPEYKSSYDDKKRSMKSIDFLFFLAISRASGVRRFF